MSSPASWPSMEDTRRARLRDAQKKRDDRPAAEWQAYLTQMAFVREAAKFSGVEQWTRAHTIGALFACQSIRSSFKMLRDMGMINTATRQAVDRAVLEQEIIAVLMEEGAEDQ